MRSRRTRAAASPPSKSRKRQSSLALDQDLDDALRRAAQRERILRAGGNQADAEAAAQRVELVGQRDDLAGAVRGIESSMLTGL